MDEQEIAEIEDRANAATAGPWRPGTNNVWQTNSIKMICSTEAWDHKPGGFEGQADAEFIAHAREDIPRLIAEIRRLQRVAIRARSTK